MEYPKPLKYQLSRLFLLAILVLVIIMFGITYLYSVPLIKQKVFEIELGSSRLALNNVFELARHMYANVEEYQSQAINAHQQQLKATVGLTESYLRETFAEASLRGISPEQARQQAFSGIRHFSYGDSNYIWIADYNGTLLSHPDPRYHGRNVTNLRDSSGNPVIPGIVDRAIRDGEGFYRYQWYRLAGNQPLEKISYVKNYPEWGFVIGSGLYLDDLGKEIQIRKQRALQELRDALANIQVAKTGYLFVFDSHNQMLIHPNPNIDHTQIQDLLNPLSGNAIAADLIKVADTGQELHYLWDKPSDPGHYVYEKLSLVRFLPGFDWYICSSVYQDELRSSSETLSNRLLVLALLTLMTASGLAYLFALRITRPLEQLGRTAFKISQGDLTAKTGIHRDDELGLLATSFDSMVERLKTNIDTLDTQVKQRTGELLETSARAQRMNAVGQLAGGLAHDFNNLLSVIIGNLLVARERYQQVEGLEGFLTPAIRASRRSADITQRLLAFARRQPLHPQNVDVEQLMTETLTLLRGSLPTTIELDYRNETSPLLARVDSSHLENALVNLALNARDAMPGGGMMYFQTRLLHIASANGYDETVTAGDYVEIRVTDEGSGFSADALKLAFEPFFSTKSGGSNSGLGLSMVYGFVKQSNGYIRIENRQPQGASIILLLPSSSHNSVPQALQPAAVDKIKARLSGKLFLLVEDNADVRDIVRMQLMQLGLQIVEAEDADEALQLIDALPDLHGMVSDIMLSGKLDGRQLARQLYEKNPASIILLISGYAHEVDLKEGISFPLLRKPFDLHDLAQALWQAAKEEEKTQ